MQNRAEIIKQFNTHLHILNAKKVAIEKQMNSQPGQDVTIFKGFIKRIELTSMDQLLKHLNSLASDHPQFYEMHLEKVVSIMDKIQEKSLNELKPEDFELVIESPLPSQTPSQTGFNWETVGLHVGIGAAIGASVFAGIGAVGGVVLGCMMFGSTIIQTGPGAMIAIVLCMGVCAAACALVGAILGAIAGLISGICCSYFMDPAEHDNLLSFFKKPVNNELANNVFNSDLFYLAYTEMRWKAFTNNMDYDAIDTGNLSANDDNLEQEKENQFIIQ